MRVDSNLLQDMQRYAFSPGPGGLPLRVYGDAAYLLRVQFQAPFRNMLFTPQIKKSEVVSLIAVNMIWFGKNNTIRIIVVVATIRVIFPFSFALLSAVAAGDFMVFKVMWAYIQIMVMQGMDTLKEE
ncbi:hypothetical protein P5673_019540 [Acropora cervicornis]|uniref:Uncharacterized protein n=1 Tax=Acropora cervicornis TaxID=6130 RepID=A0AAD9V252_ACRCE|nr:hypothetical protein P5673_019540 [Acropora cervicornis]